MQLVSQNTKVPREYLVVAIPISFCRCVNRIEFQAVFFRTLERLEILAVDS